MHLINAQKKKKKKSEGGLYTRECNDDTTVLTKVSATLVSRCASLTK